MFLCLKIYWNRQVFDLICALGVWKKTETLRHQILNSIFQMGVGHKLLLQLFLISFCIFRSKLGKRSVQRFHLISGYYLDDQHNFHTFPGNPQQILAYSWYIFKSFIKSKIHMNFIGFFKPKIPLGYHKILMILSLIII